jgi:hypothetical protein
MGRVWRLLVWHVMARHAEVWEVSISHGRLNEALEISMAS